MDYYKYQALGNDYLVIDPQKTYINLNKENIKLICDRNYGIGADGLLYGPIFDEDAVSVHIYNSDGSEAEKSGNGIRIFSRYLLDENYVVDNDFQVATMGGTVDVSILNKDPYLVKVMMGTFTIGSKNIPLAGDAREALNEKIELPGRTFTATCISVGNPHCVILLDEISKETALTYGPQIETLPLFPNRTNVQFAQIMDRQNIKIEIWERGSGYTLSSGSSSCAAVCALYKKNLVDPHVTVHMPGGTLNIEINNTTVSMIGPVKSVAEGIFTYEMWKTITG